ncbi:hypothetical protein L1987_45194 [Smallanthus sonchifolius]|uniref:Uncharacterized protein n=1 Tax=Smallanthus sonchifolius TaxID=185202 RepID=A0ACB9GRK7_9ASTR|nr:hypothetical protein L1987_45194 [Smallanthus sonchifolius]
MLLRKTIHKTKKFFNKTLQNFKSFIFGGYKKLTKAPSLTLFSTNNLSNRKMQHLDNFYKEFCEQWDTDGNNINQNIKDSEEHDIESNRSMINSQDHKPVASSSLEEQKDVGYSKHVNGVNQSNILEQKMKELEMMDVKDEEHVLDIEEVLHYYSLLTSPIYQDLVDKFFTDMYSDFNLPQPPVRSNSLSSSIRRLGPLNI